MVKRIVLTLLFLCAPAFGATEPDDWPSYDRLQPWFKEIQNQIQKQPGFDQLQANSDNHEVVCTCEITRNSTMEDLKIVKTSGSETIDRAALDLIRKSLPYNNPPNDLPYRYGLGIQFSNAHPTYPGNPVIFLLRWKGWNPAKGNRFEN